MGLMLFQGYVTETGGPGNLRPMFVDNHSRNIFQWFLADPVFLLDFLLSRAPCSLDPLDM